MRVRCTISFECNLEDDADIDVLRAELPGVVDDDPDVENVTATLEVL